MPPSVLIGRDHDLAALEPIVQQQRLVTLWGPGGSGKTRLALEVAQIAAGSFADGAHLVACGDLRDADLLVLHVARTLGLRVPDERMSLDALMEWLPARHLLLILDNCEHVLAACANLVLALLGTCPRLHVLLTSRELLSLPAEQAYPVQPLTLPPAERFPSGEAVPDVTELAPYSAIQLFVQRAKMAQPEFMLTPENASQIVKICRLLDGLPLTIELAAARVRMLALEQLADRLTRDCAILGAANRLAPARQRTLQDTIRWSYLLLTPREELLFCRLALVTGSFDLSLVEALGAGWADSSPDTVEDTVEVLARLIDKSLISVVSLEGTARYRLLDTTRHFAREQVQHLGEMETTYQLYAGWVRQMSEQAEAELQGPQQGVWLDRLEGEFEHIRTVIRWFLRERTAAEVVRVSAALVTFFEHRGHVREAIQWLEAARAHAEALEPELDAQALSALGVLHARLAGAGQTQGYLARAEHYLTQADEAFAFAIQDPEPAISEPENRLLETITEAVAAPTTTLRSAAEPVPVTTVAPLRIEAFGGGNVSRDVGTASVAWHYSMARELLFYLVDARQRTKEQICLALWPDADTEQASTHMRVTFYQLRKTLRDAAWVPHTPAGYTFNRSLPYWYDVEQFQDLIAEARAVQETQGPLDAREADTSIVGLLAKACALYRGTYLADFPPHEWILHRQTELQRNYIDALSWLGEVTERQGDTPQALDCYQRVTACDPYDEQAHAAILRCYVQLGQRSQALRYYRNLQHFLRDELGVTPDPHITAFIRTLMSQAEAAS